MEQLTVDHISRKEIEDIVKFKIKNPFYYQRALVHKSIQEEVNLYPYKEYIRPYMKGSNERLEFLGDSHFSSAITTILYEKFESFQEGELSRIRTRLISGDVMSYYAKCIGIQGKILISTDVVDSLKNERFLEDAFEAIVGAIYLDLGFEYVLKFAKYIFNTFVTKEMIHKDKNYKDLLIRFMRTYGLGHPEFDHTKNENNQFITTLSIAGTIFGPVEGKTKKKAEQNLSEVIIKKLEITEEYLKK